METIIQVKPKKNYFKRIYLAVMLWFTGRAVQAAARVDEDVRKEFGAMPDGYTFSLGAFPDGPYMVVGKDEAGIVHYLGWNLDRQRVDLQLTLKSVGLLFVLFTFAESTPVANSRDRLFVSGDVPQACAATRILDIVQVYLLPKFIAKMAIKRYPSWTFKRHTLDRLKVLVRALAGF